MDESGISGWLVAKGAVGCCLHVQFKLLCDLAINNQCHTHGSVLQIGLRTSRQFLRVVGKVRQT